jgi:release factor glutamine methyltransferase
MRNLFEKTDSLKECLVKARQFLEKSKSSTASLEARVLLSFALEKPVEWIFAHGEEILTLVQREEFESLLQRRAVGEPVARLIGEKEFWGLSFQLSSETLVPRPDSETLIESVLKLLPDHEQKYRFLDLGTGSGCLLGALLSEYPNAEGVGVDLSDNAAQQAEENWRHLGFSARARVIVGEWCDPLEKFESFDLIISNPPYIPEGEVQHLDVDVRNYDPALALMGGEDGLECYRELAQKIKPFLNPQGFVVLEIGAGQKEGVEEIFKDQGWHFVEGKKDLGGHVRSLMFSLS